MRVNRKIHFLLLCCIVISISACEQQTEDHAVADPVLETAGQLPHWLDGQVDMTPQHWLVERSVAEIDDKDAEIARAAGLLVTAADRFEESHRMIANRSAQLEDMLQEQNINETAVNLLAWFVALPTTQSPYSYSALCHYFFNLRTQGLEKSAIQDSLLRM